MSGKLRMRVRKSVALRLLKGGYRLEVFCSSRERGKFDLRIRDYRGQLVENDPEQPFDTTKEAITHGTDWVTTCVARQAQRKTEKL